MNAMQNGVPVVRRYDFWYCRLAGSSGAYEVEGDDCPASAMVKANKELGDIDQEET